MPEHCDHYHDRIEQVLQEIAANNQEHASFRRRLNDVEKQNEKQTEFVIALQKQGNAIENMAKSMSSMEKTISSVGDRVGRLEKEPADKWKKISFEIVKYIVLAAVGVAVGYILKGA